MLGRQINKYPVSNFLVMLCAKNYCTLLIFGRVIFKIERGEFF